MVGIGGKTVNKGRGIVNSKSSSGDDETREKGTQREK
jgi:hypothetical protein